MHFLRPFLKPRLSRLATPQGTRADVLFKAPKPLNRHGILEKASYRSENEAHSSEIPKESSTRQPHGGQLQGLIQGFRV